MSKGRITTAVAPLTTQWTLADERNAAFVMSVRTACANDPERLRVWASAVEFMWNGDLSRFLETVADALEADDSR